MGKIRTISRMGKGDLHLSCELPDIKIPQYLDLKNFKGKITNDNIYSFKYWAILLDMNLIEEEDQVVYSPVYMNNSNTVIMLDEIKIKSSDSLSEAQLKVNNSNVFKIAN